MDIKPILELTIRTLKNQNIQDQYFDFLSELNQNNL